MSAKNCRCDECGEIYIVTPSGGICPNGHGGVFPGITQCLVDIVVRRARVVECERECRKRRELAVAQVRALPLCRYVWGGRSWAVNGREERFRRVAGPYQPSTLAGQEDYLRAGQMIARTLDDRWCVLKELA